MTRRSMIALTCLLGCKSAGESPPAPAPVAAPAAQAAPVEAPPAKASSPIRVSEDSTYTRESGVVVRVPKEWTHLDDTSHVILEDPDKSVKVAMIESEGSDLAAAITSAWKRLDPGFSREVEQVLRPPPTEGLDEVLVHSYLMKAGEDHASTAIAKRLGTKIYTVLIDGSRSGLDRRGGQVREAVGSLKFPGQKKTDLAEKPQLPLEGARLEAFSSFVEEARQKLEIPGAAIAVVQGGKVVLERGYGLREAGKNNPVTPDTLMMIGSISKSMTTLLMATLADEGKLAWDAKVTASLPKFALGDPERTQALTLENTVCACTGMPRRDFVFLFEYAKATPESIISDLARVSPTTKLGETYQYSNQMVAVGGYAAAHVFDPKRSIGEAYDAAMSTRVFGPLGMKRTTLSLDRAEKDKDHASPHGRDLDRKPVPLRVADEQIVVALRPSGGIWSSAKEMSRYVLTEIGRGVTPEGNRVASEENLTRRWKPQIAVASEVWYGLGWGVAKYQGLDLVEHDGGTFGFNAKVAFFPKAGLGIVILTNATGSGPFLRAVRDRLVELVYASDERAPAKLEFDRGAIADSIAQAKKKLSPDPAWMKRLEGKYRSAELGQLTIVKRRESWVLDAGEWSSKIERLVEPDGAAKIVLLDPPLAGVDLLTEEEAGKIKLIVEEPQERYVFERL
jgi:CubicO group peptidase (beta-lactamase class C family)